MSSPIYTLDHIKSSYRKYQLLAVFFALVTIAAALMAALSGLQINQLRHDQQQEAANISPPGDMAPPAADPVRLALERDLETSSQALAEAQRHLSTERENVRKLMDRIAGLERQVATGSDSIRAGLETELASKSQILTETQRQLADERENVRKLTERIAGLERQLADAIARTIQQPEAVAPPPIPTPTPEAGPPSEAPVLQPRIETIPTPAPDPAPAPMPDESPTAPAPPAEPGEPPPAPSPGTSLAEPIDPGGIAEESLAPGVNAAAEEG